MAVPDDVYICHEYGPVPPEMDPLIVSALFTSVCDGAIDILAVGSAFTVIVSVTGDVVYPLLSVVYHSAVYVPWDNVLKWLAPPSFVPVWADDHSHDELVIRVLPWYMSQYRVYDPDPPVAVEDMP